MSTPLKYTDIEVRGVIYPDVRAVSEAFGVRPETVRMALHKGTLHRVGTGRVGKEPVPVTVMGVTFASAGELAAHFGVTRKTAVRAAAMERAPDIARVLVHRQGRRKPIVLGGITYASISDAERHLGFARGYIQNTLRRGGLARRQRVLAAAMKAAADVDAKAMRQRRRSQCREAA